MDSYIDDRMDPSTTRIAWNELTDNVERGESTPEIVSPHSLIMRHVRSVEAGTHQAFLETLSAHIIDPLSNFKVRSTLPPEQSKYEWSCTTLGGTRSHPQTHPRGH